MFGPCFYSTQFCNHITLQMRRELNLFKCFVTLPCGAVGWYVVCGSRIS